MHGMRSGDERRLQRISLAARRRPDHRAATVLPPANRARRNGPASASRLIQQRRCWPATLRRSLRRRADGRAVTLGAPFVGNKVDPSLFSKVALNLVHHKLFPSTSDPAAKPVRRPCPKNEWITTARMGYQVNVKYSLFGRFLDANRDQPAHYDGTNVLTSAERTRDPEGAFVCLRRNI